MYFNFRSIFKDFSPMQHLALLVATAIMVARLMSKF
jgi:hypothetical protein